MDSKITLDIDSLEVDSFEINTALIGTRYESPFCCTGCVSGCGINPTAGGCASGGGDGTIIVVKEPIYY